MGAMSVAPSNSRLSQGEADALQTIHLGSAVIALVREPVTALYQDYKKRKLLKDSLGMWESEAYAHDGTLHTPCLQVESLEAHMAAREGYVLACNAGSSTSSWSRLLAALGVEPGQAAVSWRPVLEQTVGTVDGRAMIAIDGAAFCHIINLYRIHMVRWNTPYLPGFHAQGGPSLPSHAPLVFGTLLWAEAEDQIYATFQPGTVEATQVAKPPFAPVSRSMESGTLMASYFNALEYGVSDTSYVLPGSGQPLASRVKQLVRFLAWQDSVEADGTAKPLLITHEFLEEASRIKRRLLTDGGEDSTIYDALCATVDADARVRAVYEMVGAEDPANYMKDSMHKLFLWNGAQYRLSPPGSRSRSVPWWIDRLPRRDELIEKTFCGFEQAPSGSLRHRLHLLQEDAMKILESGTEIIVDKTVAKHLWIIAFTPRDELWRSSVLMA